MGRGARKGNAAEIARTEPRQSRAPSARSVDDDDDDEGDDAEAAAGRVRLDKWLWAARFFKTRRLSVEACESGRVKLGDQALKPSKNVNVGEQLRVMRDGLACEFVVLGLSARRGPASVAQTLYAETEASRTAREEEIARRKAAYAAGAPKGRPTKRARRALIHYFAKGRSDG
jgi:ribosome-associated heat shock protein Hsp15